MNKGNKNPSQNKNNKKLGMRILVLVVLAVMVLGMALPAFFGIVLPMFFK